MRDRIANFIENNPLLERVTRTPDFIAYGRVAVFAAGTYTTVEAITNPTTTNIISAVVFDTATLISTGGAIIRAKSAEALG